jgi:osmotically inducible protein OsmC
MITESGALSEMKYSYQTRFEKKSGINPEELIAAALSGCFSMALTHELGRAGLSPERIDTTAIVNVEELSLGWTITRIQLEVQARVPGATQGEFIAAVLAAKGKSQIARLLNTNISLTGSLNSATEIFGSSRRN